jgi:hypothetical protein
MNRGITVPDDPNCVWRDVRDSIVEEYFATEAERDARFSQLAVAARTPMRGYNHMTYRNRNVDNTFFVRWTEPRGGA